MELNLVEDLSLYHGSQSRVEFKYKDFVIQGVLLTEKEFQPDYHRIMAYHFNSVGEIVHEAFAESS